MFKTLCGMLFVCLLLTGCQPSRAPSSFDALNALAARIEERLSEIRGSVLRLRDRSADLYINPDAFSTPLFPDRTYATYGKAIVYDRNPTGKSSILSTGHTPLVGETLALFRRLEHLEPLLRQEVAQVPWISMAWFATRESMGVFHPPYDMVALVPPGLDVEEDILPYRAAIIGNPSLGPVWTEPYVDITGKGYMVTVSVPVVAHPGSTEVLGVAGNDVALGPVVEELLRGDFANRMLLTKEGYVVAVGQALGAELRTDSLGQIFYLRRVEKDVPAAETFRLDRNADPRVRDLASRLPSPGSTVSLPWGGRTLTLSCAKVDETGWLLLEGVVR